MLKRMLIILFGLFAFWNLNSQDPEKKVNYRSQDTTVVERPADSLYIQQMHTKIRLDSLYKEKMKKK